MTDADIVELETSQEWREAFPVMEQLRPHLDEETFVEYVGEMQADSYRLFALRVAGEIVALAGVRFHTNMYYGRHLWVDELVTDEAHRSRGYGERLLSFLEAFASDRDCETLALSSGLQRTDAHRFYEETVEMDRVSYVYTQSLD